MRIQGLVAWFNTAKGYGFLNPCDGTRGVFVHYSAIQGGGYKELLAGEPVVFEVEQTAKGLRALRVERVTA